MAGTATVTTPAMPEMTAGINPLDRLAGLLSLLLATLWAGLFYLLSQPLRVFVGGTDAWQGFARLLIG